MLKDDDCDKDVQVDHLGLHMLSMMTMITWVSATPGSRLSICSNTSLLKLTNTGGDCNFSQLWKISNLTLLKEDLPLCGGDQGENDPRYVAPNGFSIAENR